MREKLRNWFYGVKSGEDMVSRYLLLTILIAVVIALLSFWFYNGSHVFDTYTVTASAEKNDVDGTLYRMLDKRIIKYSHDGVFCVNTSNEVEWSAAYTMSTPVCDVSGKMMLIAEQQGNQVYVINRSGIAGSFRTSMPILKAYITPRGLVALILGDGDVTWVNLYDSNGTQIVSIKTTVPDSGYPLDLAMTSDGKRMMVSFLGQEEGSMAGKISFYDFSSASSSDESHLVSTLVYKDTIFPDVFYGDGETPVAVADDGFIVFSGKKRYSEKERVTLSREIVSTFYDEKNVGFVFESDETDVLYDMFVYNLNGKETMHTQVDFPYEGIRAENGEILLYDASGLHIYRMSGREKLSVTYGREVQYFTHLSGSRSFLVITDRSVDRIRIE